jgi:hypothetical protein
MPNRRSVLPPEVATPIGSDIGSLSFLRRRQGREWCVSWSRNHRVRQAQLSSVTLPLSSPSAKRTDVECAPGHNITSANPNFGSQLSHENMEIRRPVKSSDFSLHRSIRVINKTISRAMILQIRDLTFPRPSRLNQQKMKTDYDAAETAASRSE